MDLTHVLFWLILIKIGLLRLSYTYPCFEKIPEIKL